MALFGLLSRCVRCKQMKSTSSLNAKGECASCAAQSRIAELARTPDVPKNDKTLQNNRLVSAMERERLLENCTHYVRVLECVHDGCAMVYRYPNTSVTDVDRDVLYDMVATKTYRVTVSVESNGDVLLHSGEKVVAKLADRVQMCKDWIKKGRPLICEFVAFKKGTEKVALFFYRSEADEMSDHTFDTIKLTSCMSVMKQEAICCLVPGQKLFVELDDNDKPYVRDIEYNPLGKLPAKYNRLYEEEALLGLYFDHTEKVEAEDLDGDDKEIPYVRIYVDKT